LWLAALLSGFGSARLTAQEKVSADLAERVVKALERARPALEVHLGSSFGGQRALLVLAAIHDEVPPENKTFQRAFAELVRDNLSGTYELAVRLMVMAELPNYPNRTAAAAKDCVALLAHQCDDGGFSYASGRGRMDLSNTQYGALGLRAAAALGARVDSSRWKRLLTLTTNIQDSYGGFSYGLQGAPYASMTVAGIGVLEIANQHLPTESRRKETEGRIARGWKWMDTHVADIGNPAATWSPYFHYGLERAAILSGKTQVAGKDWYELGAEMFLREQLRDGGWAIGQKHAGQSQPIDTAFAILFLRKKFKKTLENPITPGGGNPVSALGAQATDAEIERAVAFDGLRGRQAVPGLLTALRSRFLPQRKAAILVLFKLSGDDFGYQPYVDPGKQSEAIARAEEWWSLQSPGKTRR